MELRKKPREMQVALKNKTAASPSMLQTFTTPPPDQCADQRRTTLNAKFMAIGLGTVPELNENKMS